MVNYDAILYLVSIVLVLLILFMILFGCKRDGRRYYERFSNSNDDNDDNDDSNDSNDSNNNNNNNNKKKEKKPVELSGFENQILEQLSSGQLTTESFTNLIATQKFTQTNLENMINYVEQNKGMITAK